MSAAPGITIPTDQMRDILGKAIIDSLEPETKNTILAAALQYLMTRPAKDRYSSETDNSPIEYAFQNAIRKLADEVAAEVVQEARPVLAEKLRVLLAEVDYEPDFDLSLRLMRSIIAYGKDKDAERSY